MPEEKQDNNHNKEDDEKKNIKKIDLKKYISFAENSPIGAKKLEDVQPEEINNLNVSQEDKDELIDLLQNEYKQDLNSLNFQGAFSSITDEDIDNASQKISEFISSSFDDGTMRTMSKLMSNITDLLKKNKDNFDQEDPMKFLGEISHKVADVMEQENNNNISSFNFPSLNDLNEYSQWNPDIYHKLNIDIDHNLKITIDPENNVHMTKMIDSLKHAFNKDDPKDDEQIKEDEDKEFDKEEDESDDEYDDQNPLQVSI